MLSQETHQILIWTEIAFAALTMVLLLFIVAPYGRHSRAGWGPTLSTRSSWVLMELPTLAVFLPLYFQGERAFEPSPLCLLSLWLSHYVYRTLIFPFRLKASGKRTPVLIVLMGALFNSLNATIISTQLSHFGDYGADWLFSLPFVLGGALFFIGMFINRQSDRILLNLRAPGQSGYKIPHGGLYRFVSCPNYLGEIIEWTGFAVATWSPAGLAFALYTAANVGPRGLSHHTFYREKFPDYPPSRRALIPFLL